MAQAKKGIFAAAITPIAGGEPDGPKLVRYCRQLIADGCDGVAPLGTTGEANSLPYQFRLRTPELFAKAGFAGDEVLFGTGAAALADAQAFTRAAVESGFPNVLVLPPFYFKNVSDDGLYAYYSRIIDAVGSSELRVFLYHFPQMSAVPITLELVRRLRAAFGPVIAGLKDSSGDFSNSANFITSIPDFAVYPSSEGVLLKALEIGAAGVISATTNASAGLARRTLQAEGQEKLELQEALAELRTTIQTYPLSAALKRIAAWRFGDPSWAEVLPPLRGLSAKEEGELRSRLMSLNGKTGIAIAA